MSKITNPTTEPSVTCGFYNALDDDRAYDALQMSRIFDGIINDGIFSSIGTCFAVNAGSGNTVNVGVGKAWFNHTWTENDAVLPIECDISEVLLNRIDAIVIEVDATEPVRDNFIKVIKGTPASNPVRPILSNSNGVYQHALCYIYRAAGSTEIIQSDITNMIGTSETPFITGILQTVSLDELLGQWQDELNRFVASEKERATTEIDNFIDTNENDFNKWYSQMKSLMEDAVNEVDTWTINQKNTILDWFNNLTYQLSGDVAVNLQMQIDKNEIEKILMIGFVDGVKNISPDGSVITSTDSMGYTLVKTFTNSFSTCTTVLYDPHGSEIGRSIKNFSPDGNTINTETTILGESMVDIDEALDNIIDLQNSLINGEDV